MKVTLENTDKLVTLIHDGQEMEARIWEGVTEKGVACHAYITRIACDFDADAREFELALLEQPRAATEGLGVIPSRLVLG